MSGKEKKAAALEEKLQLLRSVTKSNAANNTSILVDASKYIKELKAKVDAARSHDVDQAAAAQDSTRTTTSAMPRVSVSSAPTLDVKNRKAAGFLINVSMEKSRPGLLVSVLQAFEELGLDVLDADVSCAVDDATAFRLEALGSDHSEAESVDAQMVRQSVLQAIKKCMDDDDDDEE